MAMAMAEELVQADPWENESDDDDNPVCDVDYYVDTVPHWKPVVTARGSMKKDLFLSFVDGDLTCRICSCVLDTPMRYVHVTVVF